MRPRFIASIFLAAYVGISSTAAVADDHGYVHHAEWKRGAKMKAEDWHRGQTIDYKAHHLRAPPRGYEWRQVDGNFVLAAVATGVIASVIVASGH